MIQNMISFIRLIWELHTAACCLRNDWHCDRGRSQVIQVS